MDYKASWNLIGEIRERLAGKNGDAFAKELGEFLKGGLGTPDKIALKQLFVVADHFKVDNSEVGFYCIGRGFREYFLEKVEVVIVKPPKFHHIVKHDSSDTDMYVFLGGEKVALVTLAGVFELLKLQPRGESGPLLTSGFANFFYIHDIKGRIRVVYVHWYNGGWNVDVSNGGLYTGQAVFSRNS